LEIGLTGSACTDSLMVWHDVTLVRGCIILALREGEDVLDKSWVPVAGGHGVASNQIVTCSDLANVGDLVAITQWLGCPHC